MRRLVLKLITLYQRYLSPVKMATCRFRPTCSEYAYEAIDLYGFWHGGWLALKRILRCHPWNEGGYDPVKRAGGGYRR